MRRIASFIVEILQKPGSGLSDTKEALHLGQAKEINNLEHFH